MTVTKSYSPRVAHWLLTWTPSCSTSLFTSWTRPGLFLRDLTPSEVSLVSMMNVGISTSPLSLYRRPWGAAPARGRRAGSPFFHVAPRRATSPGGVDIRCDEARAVPASVVDDPVRGPGPDRPHDRRVLARRAAGRARGPGPPRGDRDHP